MFNGTWERTSSRRTAGFGSILLQVATLGIAANPNAWEVEYTDSVTGQRVRGTGPTEGDADEQARMKVTAGRQMASVS